jgi:hypothetical protein
MHKFFEQEFDCFGRYARSHQPHGDRPLAFSASIIWPDRQYRY